MAHTIYDKLGGDEKDGARKRLIRGPDGQLQEVTGEEVQSLSSKVGLDAPPTSPMAGEAQGLSPDQSKMLGDARQKKAALDIGISGEGQLSRATRTERERSTATEGETNKLAKSATLENMGGLGDRINNLISSKFNELSSKETSLEGLGGAEIASRYNEQGGEADLSQQFDSAGNVVGDQVANYEQILVDEDMASELGFGSVAEISDLLGQDASTMTLDQISDSVNLLVNEEFNRSEQLRSIMNDPTASPAMREEARRSLRDMGAVGTLSAEGQAEDLAERVDAADTITVGGREYPLEQILSDEGLSGVIEEYNSLDEDARSKLRESNPEFAGLYDFADNYSKAIDKANKDTETAASTIKGNRDSRVDALTSGGLTSEILESIFPDWDKYSDGKVKLPEVLARVAGSPEAAKLLSGKISDIQRLDPDLMKEIVGADADTLNSLGLSGEDTAENRDRWDDTKKLLEAVSSGSMSDLASTLGMSEGQFREELGSLLLDGDDTLNSLIDADGDGKLDSWNEISVRLGSTELSDIASLSDKLDTIAGSKGLSSNIDQLISSNRPQSLEDILESKGDLLSPETRNRIEEGITSSYSNLTRDFVENSVDTTLSEPMSTSSEGISKQRSELGDITKSIEDLLANPKITDSVVRDTLKLKLDQAEAREAELSRREGAARVDEESRGLDSFGTGGRAAIAPSFT